jgi:hypothetical protein
MSSVYYRRPPVEQRAAYGGSVPRSDTCLRTIGKTFSVCGKQTTNGSQTCDECKRRPQIRGSRFAGTKTIYAEA